MSNIPKPIITRWGTWLTAAEYHAENFESLEVIEKLQDDDKQAVSKIREILKKIRKELVMQLNVIKTKFFYVVGAVTKLETRGMSSKSAIDIYKEVVTKMRSSGNKQILNKIQNIFKKNLDIENLEKLLNENALVLTHKPFNNFSPAELGRFTYAPLVSCEVERSFNVYKSLLRENYQSMTVQTIKMHMVIAYFTLLK